MTDAEMEARGWACDPAVPRDAPDGREPLVDWTKGDAVIFNADGSSTMAAGWYVSWSAFADDPLDSIGPFPTLAAAVAAYEGKEE